MKLTAASIVSIIVIAVGVLLYALAVGGVLFAQPTPAGDIGALSVLMVFVFLGLLGLWASMAEKKRTG